MGIVSFWQTAIMSNEYSLLVICPFISHTDVCCHARQTIPVYGIRAVKKPVVVIIDSHFGEGGGAVVIPKCYHSQPYSAGEMERY